MTGALRGPEPGGVGVATSDEVLALATPALDFFGQWASVWNAFAATKIDVDKDIRDKFQDSAGLDFRKFLADADALAHTRETLDSTHTDATTAATTLFRDWQSPAATAAQSAYRRLHPDALLDHLAGAAQLIPETMTHVFTALKTKVDEALKLRTDSIAGAPLSVAQRVAAVARGGAVSKDELLDLAQWLDSASPGHDLHNRLRDCEPGDNDYATRAARQWLNGPFATEFSSRYAAFQGLCATATSTIDGHFRILAGFLAVPVETSTVDSWVDSPTPTLGLPADSPTPALGLPAGSPTPVLGPSVDSSTPAHGIPVDSPTPAHGLPVGSLTPELGHSVDSPTPALGLPVIPAHFDPSSGSTSGDLNVPDDSTTASASLSDLGAHIVDPPQDQHPSAELGTAPGGDVTFDPLGPSPDSLPDGMNGFGALPLLGPSGLGTAPSDQTRTAARLGTDVFDTRASAGRISGSLDEGPGVARR
ncbi:hypothetical protein [Amycolatopsis sp. DSM 110486]|uniref:hypothetical protein n=1 Tax=Amycolatopsis sp. DSM 110486 TaxID=2865832 RepID=UPI001C69C107|nr:hypothetical protein [Amycolatopsis sp. DSM 110486]QYN24903.1 hypothetical protein K1T34_22170 [Amycolatopsis sp. DSM 110486]